jgi:hypothetical protein
MNTLEKRKKKVNFNIFSNVGINVHCHINIHQYTNDIRIVTWLQTIATSAIFHQNNLAIEYIL